MKRTGGGGERDRVERRGGGDVKRRRGGDWDLGLTGEGKSYCTEVLKRLVEEGRRKRRESSW